MVRYLNTNKTRVPNTNTMKSIWIDCEWFIGGELFILGYCYNSKEMGQLYGHSLTKYRVRKILSDVKYIYCYGPDIGVIEKHFDMDLRNKYVCINLLKVFRHFIQSDSYKLADLEKLYGIKRRRVEYKKNIFDIFADWTNDYRKRRILEYNCEDAYNLMRIWKKIRAEHQIGMDYLLQEKLR